MSRTDMCHIQTMALKSSGVSSSCLPLSRRLQKVDEALPVHIEPIFPMFILASNIAYSEKYDTHFEGDAKRTYYMYEWGRRVQDNATLLWGVIVEWIIVAFILMENIKEKHQVWE